MNNTKWTLFAVAYQCGFAYAVSLVLYQFGMLFTGNGNIFGMAAALIILVFFVYMIARPQKGLKEKGI